MTVTRDTTVKQIAAWYQENWGPIQYHTALRARASILGDTGIEHAHQFTLLPAYTAALLNEDPNAMVKLKLVNNWSSSLFIAPSFSQNAWNHVRPFIAVDAAFTRTMYDYVLLLATAIDANNQAINLAWGIVPKENTVHWSWFLENLSAMLDGLNKRGVVIMSNRQKGLNKAIEEVLPLATEGYCCKHIEANVTKVLGEEVKGPYWNAVYASTEDKFKVAMDEIIRVNPWYVHYFKRTRVCH
jgi:hypothetical protein